jgi:hypothetical protein
MMTTDYPDMVDENQGPAILAATLTVTIAALITTVTRMYVRIGMIRNVGWDVRNYLLECHLFILISHQDYTMCFAMLLVNCFDLHDVSKANKSSVCNRPGNHNTGGPFWRWTPQTVHRRGGLRKRVQTQFYFSAILSFCHLFSQDLGWLLLVTGSRTEAIQTDNHWHNGSVSLQVCLDMERQG